MSLQGNGVSHGIAIGPVHLLQRDTLEVLEYVIPDDIIEDEIQRFQRAIESTRQQLSMVRQHIPSDTRYDIAAFIDTHLLMLDDSTLSRVPIEIIRERQCNAEWALKLQRDALVRVFDEMDDPYLRTRRDDVEHVVSSIQRVLLSSPIYHHVDHIQEQRLNGHIIVADDLSPADTVLMQHQGVAGFITETGGPTSHTAILARSLNIPAIVGLHNARQLLFDRETIVIDGQRGVVIANADNLIVDQYLNRKRDFQIRQQEHRSRMDIPAVSRDGVAITLQANVELPEDIEAMLESGAEGIGLFRTEYLYMNREQPPDETEQYEIYRQLIEQLGGKPLTIRTLDLGADKQVDGGRQDKASPTNPALGLRAIRLCLQEPALFYPQLRAIYRASAHGPMRIMIPMVSNTAELIQILRHIEIVRKQLSRDGHTIDNNVPVGGMIEVPAAAINARMFCEYLDFLSIGTNDLIQYTLAIDRIDDEVNYLYDPLNPAVLKLIHMTLQAGHVTGTTVTMCGEMAGDANYTAMLLGMGLRNFSMHPNSIADVKRVILQSDVSALAQQVESLLSSESDLDFHNKLDQLIHIH
jgi:phosphotransferase system enzyme I (PtsI)